MAALRAHVGGVDPAVGADEAVARFRDQDAVGHADDAAGLAQDHLELARIAIPSLCKGNRLRPRRDGREIHDRALGLRDDLLGHDEDVVLGERQDPGRGVDRGDQQRGQVVAGMDFGHAVEGDDRETAFGPWCGRLAARQSGTAGHAARNLAHLPPS